VRGYDRENFYQYSCGAFGTVTSNCNATSLLGSRVAVFNAELRFPVVRSLELVCTVNTAADVAPTDVGFREAVEEKRVSLHSE